MQRHAAGVLANLRVIVENKVTIAEAGGISSRCFRRRPSTRRSVLRLH
jgi:hypothetical protein